MQRISDDIVRREIGDVLFFRIREQVKNALTGQCLRISDIPIQETIELCGNLREENANLNVYILKSETAEELAVDNTIFASGTKIVELRNPDSEGNLRAPLLVFIPPQTRAASEDSFGLATFREIGLSDSSTMTLEKLRCNLPPAVAPVIEQILSAIAEYKYGGLETYNAIRYILTLRANDYDPEILGAALYEFGLLPDFILNEKPDEITRRIRTNATCTQQIQTSIKSPLIRPYNLDPQLNDVKFKNELGAYLSQCNMESTYSWTSPIALESKNWKFSFDKWPLQEQKGVNEQVFIELTELNIPEVKPESADASLQTLIGQQVLVLSSGTKAGFSVSFAVNPDLTNLEGLAQFRLEVISRDSGTVVTARKKSAWKNARKTASVAFTGLQKLEWDEGWYYVRILPLDANGDMFPLVDANGNILPWKNVITADALPNRPNESDLFYVLPGKEIDLDITQRTIQKYFYLTHALLDTRLTVAASGRDPSHIIVKKGTGSWLNKSKHDIKVAEYETRLTQIGTIRIPISSVLLNVEKRILSRADTTMSWAMQIKLGEATEAQPCGEAWPNLSSIDEFIQCRENFFKAIYDVDELVVECIDLQLVRDLAIDYATSYLRVLEKNLQIAETADEIQARELLNKLNSFLRIDSVSLKAEGSHRNLKNAILISPLHPLRILWLIGWRTLADDWLAKISNISEKVTTVKKSLFDTLSMFNVPPFILGEAGTFYVCIENITPYWALYAPASEHDPRGLVGTVCSALGLAEPGLQGGPSDGMIGQKIEHYIKQHPYVTELVINVFNAGRASQIADALRNLQDKKQFSHLHYNIRFFVHDIQEQGVGEEVDALLNPSGNVSSETMDAFCSPGKSHLQPKLRYAVLPIREFEQRSDFYQSHLTLLFDLFPPEEIGTEELPDFNKGAPIHALFQDFCTLFSDTEDAAVWKKIPRNGMPHPLSEDDDFSLPLARLAFLHQRACAAIATRKPGIRSTPSVLLVLKGQKREMLHKIHTSTDWVLSIDRFLGIEFFDHNRYGERPDYLLDFESTSSQWGRRLILSSRSTGEVEKLLEHAVFNEYSLDIPKQALMPLLDQLRTLSGKLPLRLLLGRAQRAEVFGLALAKLYLQWYGALENQVIVPLDCHQNLFCSSCDSDKSRTDFAIFDLSVISKTITCRFLEVKCYAGTSLSGYEALRDSIKGQIRNTEKVFCENFDPNFCSPDRPDRLVKTLELASILEFYLERGFRFGIINKAAFEEGLFFLRNIEPGYTLKFTRSALIFDITVPKSDMPLIEDGIEFHRVGKTTIDELLSGLTPEKDISTDAGITTTDTNFGNRSSTITISLLSTIKTETAAFLSKKRERQVDWERIRQNFHNHEPITIKENDAPAIESLPHKNEVPMQELTVAPKVSSLALDAENGVIKPPSELIKTDITTEREISKEVSCDILLGTNSHSIQFGILGDSVGRSIGLDLNQVHAISLFGVQGGGKSYTLGSIIEMATCQIEGINVLPGPLCTVVFHFSPTQDYSPEFTSMAQPNDVAAEIELLKKNYGALPCRLEDIILLAPKDKVDIRRKEYPSLDVFPLTFAASDLDVGHWMFLMGAVGSQATYIRQLKQLMKGVRNDLSLATIEREVANSQMPDNIKTLAHNRLRLASEYIDDSHSLKTLARPGRMIIVDLRDEFIEKDEALGLFVVLLQIFADSKIDNKNFNKLVVFDEAHKYVENPDLVAGLIETIREMRHKGTSILVASQDPPSVPVPLIELSNHVILHKFNSPAWLRHIQKANAALHELTPQKMAALAAGEAYVWSSKATDSAFSSGVQKVHLRPRVSKHGGATKTAV